MSEVCSRNFLFIKFPGRDLGGLLTFLKGFRTEAWLASGLLVCLLPGFLYSFYLVLRLADLRETRRYSYWWNVLIMLSAIAQQVREDLKPSSSLEWKGQEESPRYLSTRLVFIMMMVSSVVLFENFNASYTSFLSVVSQAEPFHTIQELDQTGLTIGAAKGTAFQTMFKVLSVVRLEMVM